MNLQAREAAMQKGLQRFDKRKASFSDADSSAINALKAEIKSLQARVDADRGKDPALVNPNNKLHLSQKMAQLQNLRKSAKASASNAKSKSRAGIAQSITAVHQRVAKNESNKKDVVDKYKGARNGMKQVDGFMNMLSRYSADLMNSSKAINIWNKAIATSRDKLIEHAESIASLSGGWKLLKEGALEIADKYRLIADAGMAGAMTEFAGTAIKLNVTIAQLSRIVGENRASFAKTGMSIQKFGAIAESNAATLKDIGLSNEQSAAAQAKMMGGTAAALGSEQKANSSLVKKSIDDQVKAFKMLSVATGESVDALAQQYESMLKDEDLSKQLQSLRGKERQDRAQEMLTDMAHYKLLGLSNEQIKNELKLKQASQFRLNDRFSGAAQMSVLGNLMGMDAERTADFNNLTRSGKKLTPEEQARVDAYKADLAQRVNDEQQKNPNSGKNEAAQSLIAGMGGYGKALIDSGQALAGAQSKGDAQMSIADANKALIASQGQSTDRIVAAYEKQSGLIQNLMKQATVSNDKMAVVGQKTENLKNLMDVWKDSPLWSAGKMLLGAAGMLYGAARLFGKAPSIPELVGKVMGGVSNLGKGIAGGLTGAAGTGGGMMSKIGGIAGKAMPWVATAGTLAMNAKGIYDATQEQDPGVKKEKLTTSISSTVGTIVGGAIGAAFGGPIGMSIGAMLGDTLGGWVGDCINWVRDNYDKNPYVKAAVDFFKNWTPLGWLYQGIMFIWDNAQAIFDGVKTVASEAWWWIKNFTPFGWLWQGVSALIENWDVVSKWISGAAATVWSLIKSYTPFGWLWQGVSYLIGKWDEIKNWVKQYTDPIVKAFKDFHPFDFITGLFDSLVDNYYSVKKWVLEAKQSLKGKFGGSLDAEDQAALDAINKREADKASGAKPTTTAGGTPSANYPAASGGNGGSTPSSTPLPVNASPASGGGKPWTPQGSSPAAQATQSNPQGDDYLNSIIEWGGGIAGNIAHFKKMDPGLQQRVVAYAAAYFKATGKKLRINSTFRSAEEEEAVKKQNAEKGIFNGANGTSPHSRGIAVDINPASINAANSAGVKMESFGLWQPLKDVDKEFQHVQPIGTAASTAQANKLGIMSPAQAQSSGTPAMTNFTAANAPTGDSGATTGAPINTGGNSGGPGYTPSGGPSNSGGAPFGGNSSYGTSDIVALLKKIAALNNDQLDQLKNLVSNTKQNKMISEKDQMKTL